MLKRPVPRRRRAIVERSSPKPPLGVQGEVARSAGGDQNRRIRGLTIPQSRFASQLRVAAKPSRPALRPAKASGCWAAAVASSATGSAPLRALYTRGPLEVRRYKRLFATTTPAAKSRFAARTRDARPYGGDTPWYVCRRPPTTQQGGRLIAAPTVKIGKLYKKRRLRTPSAACLRRPGCPARKKAGGQVPPAVLAWEGWRRWVRNSP